MAYNKILIGLVAALVVAFVALFFASAQPAPYSKGPNYSRYESMTEQNASMTKKEPLVDEEKKDPSVVEEKKPAVVVPAGTASSSSSENFEPMLAVPLSVDYAPFRDSELIDKFSQVTTNGQEGVNGCVSSGLSNSGGYICLTPELIKLLKTRGGNAAGV
jgi:hypothetical protein